MSREAMQQALWTLEGWANYDDWVWPDSALEQSKRNTIEAITALRQALKEERESIRLQCTTCGTVYADGVPPQVARPEQEPVAWANSFDLQNFDMKVRTCPDLHHTVPLYTAPPKRELTCVCGAVWEGETMVHSPREREWVGLAALEIYECWKTGDVVKAVESKLKEKNHG